MFANFYALVVTQWTSDLMGFMTRWDCFVRTFAMVAYGAFDGLVVTKWDWFVWRFAMFAYGKFYGLIVTGRIWFKWTFVKIASGEFYGLLVTEHLNSIIVSKN